MSDINYYTRPVAKTSNAAKPYIGSGNTAKYSIAASKYIGGPVNGDVMDYVQRYSRTGNSGQPSGRLDYTQQPNTGDDLLGKVAEGGLGAIGYVFRVFTGLGRGILNGAYSDLQHANNIDQALQDGFQAEDFGKIAAEAGVGILDHVWGNFKGLASSVIPDFQKMVDPIDNRKVLDSWTELLDSKDFRNSSVGKGPVGDWVNNKDPYLSTPLGDWTTQNTVGTALDIFLDPATYLTMGIGGAVRGLGRGVGAVSKFRQSGKAADFIATNPKNAPRPFYAPAEKVTGKKLRKRVGNQEPINTPNYTVANTNPALYILKEMGRGFKEAHGQAAARLAARTTVAGFRTRIVDDVASKLHGTDITEESVIEIGGRALDDVLKKQEDLLKAKGVEGPAKDRILEALRNDVKPVIDDLVKSDNINVLRANIGRQAVANLEEIAAQKGITIAEEAAVRVADQLAASFPARTQIFPKAQAASDREMADELNNLADTMHAQAKSGGDAFGEWDAFVARNKGNARILDQLREPTSQPIGFRARKYGKKDAEAAATTTQKKAKGAKGEAPKKTNYEQRFIAALQKEWQGKNPSPLWDAKNLENDWQNMLSVRGLTRADGHGGHHVASLDGEKLRQAGISPSLLAARIRYAALRLEGPSKMRYLLDELKNRGYNPLTAHAGVPRSLNMPTTKEAAAKAKAADNGEITVLRGLAYGHMKSAAGTITDLETRRILTKLGFPEENLDLLGVKAKTKISLDDISETISNARAQKFIKARRTIQEQIAKKQVDVVIGGKTVTLTAASVARMGDEKVMQIMEQALKSSKVRSELVSAKELEYATTSLEKVRADQMSSLVWLTSNGFDIHNIHAPLYTAITRTRDSIAGAISRPAFKKVFADDAGELIPRHIPGFMSHLYAASKHSSSLDGGLFAQKIDELLASRGEAPIGNIATLRGKAQILSRVALDSAWTEYITPGLLHTVEVRTASSVKPTGAKMSGRTLKKFEDELNGMAQAQYDRLINEMLTARLTTPGWEAGKIEISPSEFLANRKLPAGSRPIPKFVDGEIFPEAAAAAEKAVANTELRVDAEVLKWIQDLYRDGAQLPVYRRVNGKTTKLGPQDTVKSGDFVSSKDFGKYAADRTVGKVKNSIEDISTKLNTKLIGLNYDKAKSAALKKIAEREIQDLIPDSLKPEVLAKWIKREVGLSDSSPARVAAGINARFWHAHEMVPAEREVDIRLQGTIYARSTKTQKLGKDLLTSQRNTFSKVVTNIETAIRKEGVKYADAKWDGKMSLEGVLESGNPKLFVDWLKNKVVLSITDRAEWESAMTHISNMTKTVDGRRGYASYKELIDSYYPTKRSRLLPGDINPATGKPVPTEQQVLQVLDALGVTRAREMLDAATIANKTDVMKLLSDSRRKLKFQEIEAAKEMDYIRRVSMVNGDNVSAMVEALPSPEIYHEQWAAMFLGEIQRLEAEGLSELVPLAGIVGGTSFAKFFEKSAASILEEDSLGRLYRTDMPKEVFAQMQKDGLQPQRLAIKENFDKETLYTGWKTLIKNLQGMADNRGLVEGHPLRSAWMAETAVRVLRLRDYYLQARGIFSSNTINVTHGEHLLLGAGDLAKLSASEKRALSYAAYISEADVMEVLGIDNVANLFMKGAGESLPITSIVPAARLLIKAMDSLENGKWFTQIQIDAMEHEMVDLMGNNILHTNRGSGMGNLLVHDREQALKRIGTVVATLLHPTNARHLFDIHTANAAQAIQILKYKAGSVSEPVKENLRKLLDSDMSNSGANMDAVKKVQDEINKMLGINPLSAEAEALARMDISAWIAARIDPGSAIILKEAQKVSKLSDEGQAIADIQGMNGARVETQQDAGELLFHDLLAEKGLAVIDSGGSDELLFDATLHLTANRQEIMGKLRFADRIMGALFSSHRMENLRSFADAPEMAAKDLAVQFEHTALLTKQEWEPIIQSSGRNYLTEAFKIIQKMPEEDLIKATTALDNLVQLAEKAKALGKQVSTLEEYGKLVEDLKILEDAIAGTTNGPADAMLQKAVRDLWALWSPVVGGGKNSAINLSGHNADWINRNIMELGVGQYKDMIKINDLTGETTYTKVKDAFGFRRAASANDLSRQWTEWEIDNPLEAVVGLNAALYRANKVPLAAANITDAYGVPLDTFANAAAAKAAGYVKIKSIKYPGQGNELIHFMPTDSYYYPEFIAQELGDFSKFLTEIKNMQRTGVLERGLLAIQPLQNLAKQNMTLLTAKNWVQNEVGGWITNYIKGVHSPLTMPRAVKMLKTGGVKIEKDGYDLTRTEALVAEYIAKQPKNKITIRPENDPVKGTSVLIRLKGKDIAISYGDLYQLFNKFGGHVPRAQSRDLDMLGEIGDGIKKLKKENIWDKTTRKLGDAAGARDDRLRATLFIDMMMKSNWKSLEDGARFAMKEVNRVHPQLQGLSTFNQKYTRQLTLFYTWRAKTLGWILMDLLDKPGAILTGAKLQYAMMQSQGAGLSQFGDFDPAGPTPSYLQGNMDPTFRDPVTGELRTFTISNPVTDLLGTSGWLSGLRFNSYDSPGVQAVNVTMNTYNKFVNSSQPLLLSLFVDSNEFKTQGGTKLMSGGSITKDFIPLTVEDALSRIGWGPQHTFVASLFPEIALKAAWDGKSKEQVDKAKWDNIINWITGLRLKDRQTLDIRQKGVSEVLAKLQDLNPAVK
jgi:hypothetical protein